MKDYKKTLKGVVDIINTTEESDIGFADICAYIGENCPELKESEDEKIRQFLIREIEGTSDEIMSYRNMNKKDVLTWLEKHGEQNYKIIKGKNYFCVKTHNYAGVKWIKGTKYYASDNYTLVNQGCECYCPEYSKEEHNKLFEEVKYDGCVEKQGEQKPDDKVEPKFEIGDWVVYDHRAYQIVELPKEGYINLGLKRNGKIVLAPSTYCKHWTIQDAKDGDVLVCPLPKGYEGEDQIFIFKSINSRDYVDNCIEYYCRVCDGVFYENRTGYMGTTSSPLYPATQEQRDLLFQKMKEAGYEWDSEKNKLKKIKYNSAWSEEDEIGLANAMWSIKQAKTIAKDENDMGNIWCAENWLKSLRPQSHWKPSDLPHWKKNTLPNDNTTGFNSDYFCHKGYCINYKELFEKLPKDD